MYSRIKAILIRYIQKPCHLGINIIVLIRVQIYGLRKLWFDVFQHAYIENIVLKNICFAISQMFLEICFDNQTRS